MLKNPPKARGMMKALLVLGLIIFSIFAYLTFEEKLVVVSEPEYDWSSGEIGIVGHKIFAEDSPTDQITMKNNQAFTVLVREFRVNGVDLTGGKSRILSPGQAVTLKGSIGAGEGGTEYEYTVSIRYDDFDDNIVGYEWAPEAKLKGRYE